MRSTTPYLALLLLSLAAPPLHAWPIVNLDDFEDGTLDAWQMDLWSVEGEVLWEPDYRPGTPGPLPPFPATGNYQARTATYGNYATGVLHRAIAIPAGADAITLRLWYSSGLIGDMGTLEPGGQGQALRIDLLANGSPILGMNGILATPFHTTYPSPDYLAPTTLTIPVSAWQGQTVILRIAAMSNTQPMDVGIDDVTLHGDLFVSTAAPLPGVYGGALDWGDFDSDGDLDLVLVGAGPSPAFGIYRNDGGAFVLHATPMPAPMESGDVQWADVDNDGDLDLIAVGREIGGPARLHVGVQASGVFTWSTSPGAANTNLAITDADLDGDLDFAFGSNDASQSPFRRNTGGVFLPVPLTFTPVDSATVFWYPDQVPELYSFGRDGVGQDHGVYHGPVGIDPSYLPGAIAARGAAEVRFADFNANGTVDYYMSGRNSLGEVDAFVFRDQITPLMAPPLYWASADWSDADGDGFMDLITTGTNPDAPLGQLLPYTGFFTGTASTLVDPGQRLDSLIFSHARFGDFDADGDPDLALMGVGYGGFQTQIHRNRSMTTNLPPSAVAGTTATPTPEGAVLVGWLPASDDHTAAPGLTYNLRIGHRPGGEERFVAMADPVTGRRRVHRPGNMGQFTSCLLPNLALATPAWRGPLYWAVQALDGAHAGGPWSQEQRIVGGGHPLAIRDVPGDQGGRVRITLRAGVMDTTASSATPVTSYGIWRRVPSGTLQQSIASEARPAASRPGAEIAAVVLAEGLPLLAWRDRTFAEPMAAQGVGFPEGTWELVATVPALQQPTYLVEASTLADSGASGANWSVFAVTSHTATPSTWWVSHADSGKSVDNIAPGVPQGLVAQFATGSGNQLTWQSPADPDFQYHRVYRGPTPDFTPSPATLVASVAGSPWTDPGSDSPGASYKVTSLDHSGNESAPAAANGVLGVGDGPGVAFALNDPAPSPFRGSTRITFSLARAGHTTLGVFDAQGRRVRTLVRGTLTAGPHEARWDGRGQSGTRLGPGLYFLRLQSDDASAVRRVVQLE